jgi:hypothetical protein
LTGPLVPRQKGQGFLETAPRLLFAVQGFQIIPAQCEEVDEVLDHVLPRRWLLREKALGPFLRAVHESGHHVTGHPKLAFTTSAKFASVCVVPDPTAEIILPTGVVVCVPVDVW